MKDLDFLKKKLSITWNKESLLTQALTHSSYTYENKDTEHYQRLEFLGDAVLELVISDYLFKTYPNRPEGELTKLRALIVCEPSLARAAKELELGDYLLIGRGEERSGGRCRPSTLADAFEALLGAIYLDQGLECVQKCALSFLATVISDVIEGRVEMDYKTELQEFIQQHDSEQVNYVILQEKGPAHNKIFTAGVLYKGKLLGKGTGYSKKEAEQQAARIALSGIKDWKSGIGN